MPGQQGPQHMSALRTALLSRWHSLSEPTRRLVQVLAVAGRPVAPTVLADAAGVVGAPCAAFGSEPSSLSVWRRTSSGITPSWLSTTAAMPFFSRRRPRRRCSVPT